MSTNSGIASKALKTEASESPILASFVPTQPFPLAHTLGTPGFSPFDILLLIPTYIPLRFSRDFTGPQNNGAFYIHLSE